MGKHLVRVHHAGRERELGGRAPGKTCGVHAVFTCIAFRGLRPWT